MYFLYIHLFITCANYTVMHYNLPYIYQENNDNPSFYSPLRVKVGVVVFLILDVLSLYWPSYYLWCDYPVIYYALIYIKQINT